MNTSNRKADPDDANTTDMLTQISRGIDESLWKVEARSPAAH